MGIIDRINGLFTRQNLNPSLMTDEAIEQPRASAYCDPLIYFQHDNFGNIISRRMCLYLDPLINALTEGWASLATAKSFKFYSSHGVDGEEIMQEYRQWWKMMNLDELLKAIIPHFTMDGSILFEIGFNNQGSLEYETYGSYECNPTHWYRDSDNNILWYNVQYTPMPRPFNWNYGGAQLQGVSKQYVAGELIHITRGSWNYGLGNSRVLPIWDSAVKLRTGSHADFFRRDIRFLVAVPEGWKDDKASSFMQSMNDFLRSRRRSFVYRMEQAKTAEQTPLELPRFGFESLAENAPNPKAQSEAGGALLRDPEWARFLSGCKHTENYFIGNQSGAVTGSEVDLTRDFYTECEEFALLEPVIKAILNWFVERKLIPPPPQDYVIKYWKDWEHTEMAAQLAAQEMQQDGMGEAQYREQSAYNLAVQERLLLSVLRNNAMPMTPVKSSWIKAIGYDEGSIYMQVHEKTKKGIDTYEYNLSSGPGQEIMSIYGNWVDSGSKGGYWWDYIRDVYSPAFKHGKPPAYLETGYGGELEFAESVSSREYKIKGEPAAGIIGAGTTRSPYGIDIQSKPYDFWKDANITRGPEKIKEASTTSQSPGDYNIGETTSYDWGYVHNPKSITGATKVGPGRKRTPGRAKDRPVINPVNITKPVKVGNERTVFNSAAALMRLAKDKLNWGMSKTTAYNIIDLVDQVRKGVFRVNAFAYGNGIKADHPMYYDVGGTISKEFVCPDSYKKNIGKKVPLGIYHNKDRDSPELPDWQIIGTYTINGWDEENGQDIAEIEYDEERINEVFKRLGEPNWIKPYIDKGELPDVSTAYYCDVTWDGRTKRNLQTNIDIKSVSFVPAGNCPRGICTFTPERSDTKQNRWITKKGRHIWIETNYTPEEYTEAIRYKGPTEGWLKKDIQYLEREAELDAWLTIDKNVDLTGNTVFIRAINRALDVLPLKIKKMIKDIKVYNSIAEDPYFLGRQNDVPESYKKVGCDKTYKEVGGCYIPNEDRALLRADSGSHTLYHEIGHAVWYGISEADRLEFKELRVGEYYKGGFEGDRIRTKLGDYEANDVKELFAESFARYWSAKQDNILYDWNRKQRQKIGWISRFFNTRMQKYFKEE